MNDHTFLPDSPEAGDSPAIAKDHAAQASSAANEPARLAVSEGQVTTEDQATYALFASGTPYADHEVEGDEDCFEVHLAWTGSPADGASGVARTLDVRHIKMGESLSLGVGSEWVVPESALGSASHVLVKDGQIFAPPGATLVTDDSQDSDSEQRYQIGDFMLIVRRTRAARNMVPRIGEVDTRPAGIILGTMVVAGAFLLLSALLPPSGMAMNNDPREQRERLADMMMAMQEHMPEEPIETTGEEAGGDEAGQAESGDEGAMGDETSDASDRRYAIEGNARRQDHQLSRHEQRAQASTAGIVGVLSSMSVSSPTSVFGADTAIGSDPVAALGAMTGSEIGDSFGAGGLGNFGTGRGGGGNGLGTIGVNFHGGIGGACGSAGCRDGRGPNEGGFGTSVGGGRPHESQVPRVRSPGSEVTGGLSREVIRRVIQRNIARIRHCYQQELQANPSLAGRVSTRFVITPAGSVGASTVASSTLRNASAEQCVAQAVGRMNFPATESPSIVTYPFVFSSR